MAYMISVCGCIQMINCASVWLIIFRTISGSYLDDLLVRFSRDLLNVIWVRSNAIFWRYLGGEVWLTTE